MEGYLYVTQHIYPRKSLVNQILRKSCWKCQPTSFLQKHLLLILWILFIIPSKEANIRCPSKNLIGVIHLAISHSSQWYVDLRVSIIELLLNILICGLHIQSSSHKKKLKNRGNTVVMVTEVFKSTHCNNCYCCPGYSQFESLREGFTKKVAVLLDFVQITSTKPLLVKTFVARVRFTFFSSGWEHWNTSRSCRL